MNNLGGQRDDQVRESHVEPRIALDIAEGLLRAFGTESLPDATRRAMEHEFLFGPGDDFALLADWTDSTYSPTAAACVIIIGRPTNEPQTIRTGPTYATTGGQYHPFINEQVTGAIYFGNSGYHGIYLATPGYTSSATDIARDLSQSQSRLAKIGCRTVIQFDYTSTVDITQSALFNLARDRAAAGEHGIQDSTRHRVAQLSGYLPATRAVLVGGNDPNDQLHIEFACHDIESATFVASGLSRVLTATESPPSLDTEASTVLASWDFRTAPDDFPRPLESLRSIAEELRRVIGDTGD